MQNERPPALLVSHNVAGFKTYLAKVGQFVKGGFKGWLERQGADIVCLQEVKISRKDVTDEPLKWCAKVPGWDSFWSFNDGSGGQRLGLNGVTTFVRNGLCLGANGAPLGDPALDGEGRCVLTDHGSFVVFNVYVPNAGNGSRLPYKQQWLHALRKAMNFERQKGKAVLLVGDLNMKHRGVEDVHWEFRQLCVPVFLAALQSMTQAAATTIAPKTPCLTANNIDGSNGQPDGSTSSKLAEAFRTAADWCEEVHPDVASLASRLSRIWPQLRVQLLAKDHRQLAYANSKQAMVPKWRIFVPKLNGASTSSSTTLDAPNGGQSEFAASEVMLGKPLFSEEDAKMSFCLQSIGVTEQGCIVYGDAAVNAAYTFGAADSLHVDELGEVLNKVCGWPQVPRETLKHLSAFLARPGYRTALAQREIEVKAKPVTSRSMDGKPFVDIGLFCGTDGMVDAFAHFYPQAFGRATCWNQQQNARYQNMGGRIDYTLVDGSFFEKYALKGDVPLDCGLCTPQTSNDSSSSNKSTLSKVDVGSSNEEPQAEGEFDEDGALVGSDDANKGSSCSVFASAADRTGPSSNRSSITMDPNSRAAALAACTLSGTFKPVPMSGGGLEDAPQWAYDHHFRPPATGMIYTPPQYSDHIAVSLLLRAEVFDDVRAATGFTESAASSSSSSSACSSTSSTSSSGSGFKFNAATRKCQQHLATSSITSFFGKPKAGAAPRADLTSNSSALKRPSSSSSSEPKPKKSGLHSFFKSR